jgi:hypothetical protein
MRKFFFTLIIFEFLLLQMNVSQAQTRTPKLNQVELMKQFLGSWKGEVGKDTIIIGYNTQFGTGLECSSQIVTQGKVLDSVKQLFGYDKAIDKFIIAELIKSSPVIELCGTWFTSEHSGEMVLFKDMSDPSKAALRWKFEFKTPDMIIQTALLNDKIIKVLTITRQKN